MKVISIECALFLRNASKAIRDASEQKSARMATYYIERAIADLEAAQRAIVPDTRGNVIATPPVEEEKPKEKEL